MVIYHWLQNGYTPLHQAAQQGHTHIINVLLQYGAKPNATTAVSLEITSGFVTVFHFSLAIPFIAPIFLKKLCSQKVDLIRQLVSDTWN